MDLALSDRVAVIAGSSRGIGRAIAEAFVAEGARVVLTGRQETDLARAEADLGGRFGARRVIAFAGDLGDPRVRGDLVAQVRSRWETIDVLIANVGSGSAPPGWQVSATDWEASFTTNLWTSIQTAQTVLPTMLEAGRGSIVFIASIAGRDRLAAPLPYSAAKAALLHYSKNLAGQLAPSGVRVNCVAPGNVLFDGGSWAEKLAADREMVEKHIDNEVPMRRFGSPEEIAAPVVFLASDQASFITGTCLVADGGQTRSP